jgi:general secretion pathway protein D
MLNVGRGISCVCCRRSRYGFVASSLLVLAACSGGPLEQRDDQSQNAYDTIQSADLRPRDPEPIRGAEISSPQAKPMSFFGMFGAPTPAPSATPDAAEPADVTDGYTLNFENSPIANVAKVILGDIMGVGYVVDPRAQGTITLSSGRPIAKKDVLFVLESALHANNLVMMRDSTGYRIVPANEGGVGPTDRADEANGAEPGYGMTVVPLHYISGPTLARLLEGFAARPGAVRTDPSGTLLIVIGSGDERQSAVDTVRSFDVDWMRGQSVGIYPVTNSSPEPVIAELEKIMDSDENGLNQSLVKFQAIARQNAILVVTSKPQLLKTAATWIARLDSPANAGTTTKVYRVRYGDAKEIAQLLNELYVNGSSAGSTDTAANQIAPSSGATALTPTQRLTGASLMASSTGAAGGASGAGGAGGGGQTAATKAFGGIPTSFGGAQGAAPAGQEGAGGALLPGVRITADAANNSILIYASAENHQIIERTLNELDRPKLQVAIDVTIAEVTLNDALNYGVQFFLANHLGAIGNTVTGQLLPTTATVNSVTGATTTTSSYPPGFNIVGGNPNSPQVILNALHALTDVKILSNPSLVVVDNEQATLEVGDQVPITTGSADVLSAGNAVVNTVDYKDTGIIMHVQPRVNANGVVLLAIDQEISSVPENSTSLTPTISQRKVKSSISVQSGQMVLLAGLVSETQSASRSGVPILDQLPYIGAAFGTTGKSKVRTELIMLIRPQIIRNGADASMVAEELRSKMRGGRIDSVALPASLNVLAKPLQ